ncbi:hypothetical protein [uncultured Pseudodesulfovibrio sp.]|uniref:hypothetical protein n=1 Tax=uncultured Pseudodesulfovibrio sp. TaxID=2035858 RepID=UPI0029C98B1E|nr:hypothetical protein [uncultured Pseudodesulfovibrio sp.]
MSTANINCPYCSTNQDITTPGDYRPFYVTCSGCSRRFIAEPVENGTIVYRDGEAPCCSDPECRETEMGGSGED